MYIGMGSKDITFESVDSQNLAKFYLNSVPAHATYPTKLIKTAVISPSWSIHSESGSRAYTFICLLSQIIR